MATPLRHLVLIPDGNRRWARARKLLPHEGHAKGFNRFWEIVKTAFDHGVSYVTIWAASEGNLTERSNIEVRFIVSLLQRELEKSYMNNEFVRQQIRVRFFGRWRDILKNPEELSAVVQNIENQTAKFRNRTLSILFGYDGKQEMMEAIRRLRNTSTPISYDTIKRELWTADLPPVDLAIRTGGEPHWSAGFMMWHTADSQFYFTEILWPDFTDKELLKAFADYAKRERRFGK